MDGRHLVLSIRRQDGNTMHCDANPCLLYNESQGTASDAGCLGGPHGIDAETG